MGSHDSGSYEQWKLVAKENGVEDLFECFLASAKASKAEPPKFNKMRSVAIHYTNYEGTGGAPPLFSLHPRKSNSDKGLWIGYSEKNASKLNVMIGREHLPPSFEDHISVQAGNRWHFGYFAQKEDIMKLFSALRR